MILTDENKNEYEVNISKLAGVGGQGAVLIVENNPRLVVKVIRNADDTILKNASQYESYRKKILGVIARANVRNLASPICMLEKPYCGYVMRFMDGMRALETIMLPKGRKLDQFYFETGGLLRRYRILREIAKTLTDMYEHGLVYSDLSPKNIFISGKESGYESWLIDVDNLHYEGEPSSCVGTPMYRAPEVFCGQANTLKSDVYSFAILAFELLTFGKPFDGDYTDPNEEDDWGVESTTADDFYSKMERGDIPFVGAEDNKTNHQTGGIPIPYVMNDEILKLFRQTFGEGRKNPSARPAISTWLSALELACKSLENACERAPTADNSYLFTRRDEGTLAVNIYDVVYFVADGEDGQPVYEAREERFLYKTYINERVRPFRISGALFDPNADQGAFVTVQRKNGKYRFSSSRLGAKLLFAWKNQSNLNGLVIESQRNGLTVRRLEFFKEESAK